MTLLEYIDDYYPIRDQVERKIKDPITMIMEKDDLPCDDVKAVDGKLQKVVYMTDDEYIPVIELLSYVREEVERMPDSDFKEVWFAYMDNITVNDMDLRTIVEVSKQYTTAKERKEELVKKCMQ